MKNTIDYHETLALRIDESNPNHHLWNNNGTWWIHFTVYPSPVTAERRRKSLKTKNRQLARKRRDQILSGHLLSGIKIAA
jgi:hypothetical protein